MKKLPLKADEVHLWRIDCDGTVPWDRIEKALDERELEMAGRLRRGRDSRRFMVAHAAVRSILARYLGTGPELIDIRRGLHGKPELGPPGIGAVAFNLAHSDGIALLAVTAGREVGVDVEKVRDDLPFMDIAESCFSGREASLLRTLPPGKRPEAFFIIWTRREALMKALGTGLNPPPGGLDIPFKGRGTRRIAINGMRWWLRDVKPAHGFRGAVAGNGDGAKIKMLEWDGSV